MAVIMSTHNLERAAEWFDRLIVLNRRVLDIGTPDEVLASGTYAQLHGEMHVHGHGERHERHE
jgi:ABC-type Mn2+/Zn2+ transport system ATPase subunit